MWDSQTLIASCQFRGQLTKGISSVAFTSLGDKLAAAAIDEYHEIAIFDIQAKTKNGGSFLSKTKGGSENILELRWKSENNI